MNVTVRQAVAKEVDGPGKLLGYRAMQKKLRQEHELEAPCDLVYTVMQDADPEGLRWKRKTKEKRQMYHQRPKFCSLVRWTR